jgi:hypothetical protein
MSGWAKGSTCGTTGDSNEPFGTKWTAPWLVQAQIIIAVNSESVDFF